MSSSASGDRVQHTNDEATATKAHAVRRGYWKDPYISQFCPLPSTSTPEINRGYFVRVQTFEAMVVRFILDNEKKCQIVNLGAGSDTLFFRLKFADLLPESFVEIDLPANTKKKISIIKRNKVLWNELSSGLNLPSSTDDTVQEQLSIGSYHLFSHDLCDSPNKLVEALCRAEVGPKLSTSLPTFFIAECVLVYVPTPASEAVLTTLAATFTSAAFLNYEQVNMGDRFGEIMIRSFRDRSCELPGLAVCSSLATQKKRFNDAGWSIVHAWTINEVYGALSPETTLRIERLEMLDDREITKQLYDHYCIVLATNNAAICDWSTLKAALSGVK